MTLHLLVLKSICYFSDQVVSLDKSSWSECQSLSSVIRINILVSSATVNLPDNLPDWASPGNWLGLEGHADLKNPVNDPSLCNLCSFPLKLFKDEAEITSSLNEFHLLTILSEKKCCLRSVITHFYVTSESVLLFFRCDWVQKNVLNMTADNPWIIL